MEVRLDAPDSGRSSMKPRLRTPPEEEEEEEADSGGELALAQSAKREPKNKP